jgi:hypothetical protein
MKPKTAYLWLCVLGTVLPYSQLLSFLREHGLDLRLFVALFLFMREARGERRA